MGCIRRAVGEAPEIPLTQNKPTPILEIPKSAKEGTMEFKNVSGSGQTVRLRFGQGPGSKDVSLTRYTVILLDGESWSLDGLIPGWVIGFTGDVAGAIVTGATYYVP